MRIGLKPALIAAVASLVLAAPAAAKTYEVNKRSDHAPNGCKKKDCTLREAVLAANARGGSDRIVLPKNKTYNLSIADADPDLGEDAAETGDLDITGPLNLVHPGKGRAKVDANGIDRVFDVLARTSFKRVVIRGGASPAGPDYGDDFGGGIRGLADVTLKRTVVTQNSTIGGDGGGIGFPEDDDVLTVKRSVIKANHSDDDGGGVAFDADEESASSAMVIDRSKFISNVSEDWGGGFITDAPVTMKRSTFANNEAIDGNGGGASIEEPAGNVVRDTTFSGNSANDAGGLGVSSDSDATLTNVTIASNIARDEEGGGLWVNGGSASVNAVTIVRNEAGLGGGLYSDTDGLVEVENSLLALNAASSAGPDCLIVSEPLTSLGHNLLGTDQDCDGFDATGDFVNSNPKLGKLKNNGGPTQTVALKKGSPAINKAAKSAPNKDQRGEKRGKKPDIGAYERVKSKKKKKGRR
jgi:CSLREA domain-containing protein